MTTTTDAAISRTSEQPPTTNQKLMSQSFIESAAWWCAVLAVVSGAVAAGFGFFAWYFANKESELKAAALKKFQSDARAQIADANSRAAEASKQAVLANERTEKIRQENIQMEADLAPRIFKDQWAAGKRLAVFSPIKVVIQFIPDRECRATAQQIAPTLHDFANWSVSVSPAKPEEEWSFSDGITVHENAGGASDDGDRVRVAVDELVDELNKTGMKARTHAALNEPGADIIVRVGMKPNPVMERLNRETLEPMIKQTEETMRQIKAERRRRWEEKRQQAK